MKKRFLIAMLFATGMQLANAQIKEGKISYERTINMRRGITDPEMRARIPETRTEKFELLFNEQASLFRSVADEDGPDPFANSGGDRGGQRFRFRMSETTTYTDLGARVQYEARSFFEKDFLIVDSLKPVIWKLTDETKIIAKHQCKKATTTSLQMNMMNFRPPSGGPGNPDTARAKTAPKEIEIVVWYAEDIPVAVGPDTYGGLPGAILEINSDNGASITTVTGISTKYAKKELTKPTKGEKMTRAQFQENMKKIMEDMQKNGRMPGMRPN